MIKNIINLCRISLSSINVGDKLTCFVPIYSGSPFYPSDYFPDQWSSLPKEEELEVEVFEKDPNLLNIYFFLPKPYGFHNSSLNHKYLINSNH